MTVLALMTDDEVSCYGANADAGFGALETERGALPLEALRVRASISGVFAATEVMQTFANTTGVAIEATYIFPLPDRAAVHRFRMEVAGRVVEGIVDERAAARADYDEAIAAGHRAAITEEERPGVFTLRVGNLMPNERATVILSLVGPLPIDDGEVTFRFPLVVAPRYIPGSALGGDQAGLGHAADTDIVPDASRISPPVRLPGMPNPVALALEVAFDELPAGLASSLHAVHSADRGVRVEPGERLDRDFILRWRVDDDELRSSLICADDADGTAGTFMLTLVPPSTRTTGQKPRDVVLVIDRSGSMAGWKMVAARRAAARIIDTLTSRDRFCVFAFDDHIDRIPASGLVEATDRVRFRAIEELARIDARGGTEIAEPLRLALAMLAGGYDDRERVVVLVTDGQVGNEDDVLEKLGSRVKNVRMFTLGIDQAVNAGLLCRLAGLGAGMCELVESEDRLDAVMATFHRRIGMPIASELALRGTFELDRTSFAPARVPDAYAGAPVVVLGRYVGTAPATAAVELVGTSCGDLFHASVTRTRATAAASWLAASWARARIRELEDRYAIGEHQHEAEIVAVSKRFTVLSRFTAFVAVDRTDVVNRGGRVAQLVQAVEPPAGWAATPQRQSAQLVAIAGAGMTLPLAMPAPPAPMGAPPPITAMNGQFESQPVTAKADRGHVSPPPAPASPKKQRSHEPSSPRAEASVRVPTDAYLTKLAELERVLANAATRTALRLARQRLADWVEDVRSVGLADLATQVDVLVQRLLATLDVATARAVAAELAVIATTGGDPPKPSRLAFWK